MIARNKGLSRQVFEVDPGMFFAANAYMTGVKIYKFRSNFAAKGFDQNIPWHESLHVQHRRPGSDLYTGAATRGHPAQGAGIVHPQAHPLPPRGQLAA